MENPRREKNKNKKMKCENPKIFNGSISSYIPCGRCRACVKMRVNDWLIRLEDEMTANKENIFLTLTYNEDNKPKELNIEDYQLFLKRLRKKISPTKIKYFLAAEYGDQNDRPHYHILIFGWKPKDSEIWKTHKDYVEYMSPDLSEIWGKGYTTHSNITSRNIRYCFKYMYKQKYKEGHKIPPFTRMSNGLGEKGASEDIFIHKKIRLANNKSATIPRYYIKLIKRWTELELPEREDSEWYKKRGRSITIDDVIQKNRQRENTLSAKNGE